MDRAIVRRLAQRVGPEIAAVIVAVTTARFIGSGAWRVGFPLDDAWIHMVYGLALRNEGALAYNAGTPATGCTSPLWAGFVALAHLLSGAREPSMAVVVVVKWIGILLHAICAFLATKLARECLGRSPDRSLFALSAGLLVALFPIGAFGAVSGMETPLASALLLASFLAASRARPALTGFLIGIATSARPECLIAAPIARLIAASPPSRITLRAFTIRLVFGSICASLPIALLIYRNIAISHRPLPATFYAKAHHFDLESLPFDLELAFVAFPAQMPPLSHLLFWIALVLSVAFAIAALHRGRVRATRSALLRPRIVAGAITLTGIGYMAAVALTTRLLQPTVFYFQRYLLPPLPLLIVAAVVAIAFAASHRTLPRTIARSFAAVLIALAIVSSLFDLKAQRASYASQVGDIDAVQVTLGRRLDASLPPDAIVWSQDAGALRYWGRRRVLDLNRLNTPELFTSTRIDQAWWPDAIVVAPTVFRPAAPAGVLDVDLAVTSPSHPEDPLGMQEILRCRSDRPKDDRVGVLFGDKPRAIGRCARR